MNRSSKNKFQVFEFDDNDNGVEQFNYKFRGRLETQKAKKKRDDSPITKYHFLQSFAGWTKNGDQGRSEPIDVDAKVVLVQESKTREEKSTEFLDIDAGEPLEDGPVKIRPIATASSEIRSTETTTASSASSTFCTPENKVLLEKQLIDLDCKTYEIDDEHKTVKIFPNFIIFRDISLVESRLTFSCNGIKLEGSSLDGTRRTFCSEWTNKDVTKIESDWNESVATAMVCLHLRTNNSKRSGNANNTSGVEQLIFAVYDRHWSQRQEAIKSLDERYRDKWNIEIDVVSGEKEFLCGSIMFSPNQYFSSSDKPCEDVIYPKGDPDAVIIHKRDLELLEPQRFINDTIIDFYVKYLARNLQSEEKRKFYFFNSFFFRKLADLDKDRSSAYESKAAFQRVRKWTMKFNIFERDFIFIPVNYSFHWSLLVICYPGEVPNSKDEESGNASKVPCILHMDSLRGSHKGLKNLIQSYLCEEWKEKHNDTSVDASSKFLQMKFVPLELPQQENLYDCGLFLLHYVELFLEEAPLNIAKFSNFLSRNWFVPEDASLKRYHIKKLLNKIFEDQSQSSPKADNIDTYPSRVPDGTSEVIVLEQIGGSAKTDHGISSRCNAESVGVLLSESSGDVFFGKSGLVCSELSEQGGCSNSYTDENYLKSTPRPHGRTTRTKKVEEIDEEQVPESPLDMGYCEEVSKFKICRNHEVYSFLDSPLHKDDNVNLDNEFADCVVKDSDDEDNEHKSHKLGCFRLTRNRNRKRRFNPKTLFNSR